MILTALMFRDSVFIFFLQWQFSELLMIEITLQMYTGKITRQCISNACNQATLNNQPHLLVGNNSLLMCIIFPALSGLVYAVA
jgi:hypothetical protein